MRLPVRAAFAALALPLALLFDPLPASAQGPDTPRIEARPASGAIDVDGVLEEEAWPTPLPVVAMTQVEPDEGAAATQATRVAVRYGDGELYVGARLEDEVPEAIAARVARRDQPVQADHFEVTLDAFHDHVSAAVFRVTAGGARYDARQTATGGVDASWDPVWEAATARDARGWTVEMRIPLSQLGFSEGDDVWGLQLARRVLRLQEESVFAFTPETEHRGISAFGHLAGMGAVHSPARLEVAPYVATQVEARGGAGVNPLVGATEVKPTAGADLKYHVSEALTLDATINPDFGQAEVDPAVVNLSAFETFFPEKRPFFVEGADAFAFGRVRTFGDTDFPSLFHSRRIGRRPRHTPSGARFVDAPDETTIAGATKLTGRTRSGWTVGVLDAVTLDEQARYIDGEGAERRAPVAPLTNHFVGRVAKDFDAGATRVGAFTSAVHRDLEAGGRLEGLVHERALVGGLDLNHAWGGREWVVDANVAASHVHGSPAAIARTQRSSARYYQRPDAESFELDPTRTGLAGWAYQLSAARQTGEHWRGSVTYQEVSPGFEANDLGFQTEADYRAITATAKWRETDPNAVFRNVELFGVSANQWNFDGDHIDQLFAGVAWGQLANWWPFQLQMLYRPETADPRLTRGGPIARTPASRTYAANLKTDPRHAVTAGVGATYREDDAGSWLVDVGPSLTVRPGPNVSVELTPSYTRRREAAQFVDAVADAEAGATGGTRYLFGELDQHVLSLEARADWTVTPDLSAQLFVQPFVSTSRFDRFKEFARPGTFAFNVYGDDVGRIERQEGGRLEVDPDGPGPVDSFTFRDPSFEALSLRGNAVVRWEWRPGSTLFAVWQQDRQGLRPGPHPFELGRDLGDVFEAPSDDTFLLKATYWLDF